MAMEQISMFNFDEEPQSTAEKKQPKKPLPKEIQSDDLQNKDDELDNIINHYQIQEDYFAGEIAEEIVDLTQPNLNSNLTNKKTGRGRMKIADMAGTSDLIDIPGDEELFSKRYYNIGAVADMFKVNVSLIRYWEKEFPILKPKKNGKGDRLFRPEDVKQLKMIYHLLREKKYTIEGANEYFKYNKKADSNMSLIDSLKNLQSFLLELKATL